MAIEEGDPRVLVPEFLSKLTRLERNQAVRFYALRHASKGKKYPPDEAPASVARRAMVLGSYAGWSGVLMVPCIAVVVWSATAGMNLSVVFALEAASIGVGVALGALRHRQINRYFDERFPGS
jgi:hypothetical protein